MIYRYTGQMQLPEIEPIIIGHYVLGEQGVEIHGKPTFDEHQGVGEFIRRSVKCASWWMVDWLAYGDTREDWTDAVEALVDAELLTPESAKQYRHIGKHMPHATRVRGVAFGHHAVVARLDLDDETRHDLLEQSKVQGWTQRELRQHARATRRRTVFEGQAPTLHTVDVTVRLVCEADTSYEAEQIAWGLLKQVIVKVEHAHVIAAHALPHVGVRRKQQVA